MFPFSFQAIIFNVKKGPFVEDFYQCVTFGSYAGEWQSQLYTVASLLLMFVIPLVTIGTAYGLIFCTISRKSKEFTGAYKVVLIGIADMKLSYIIQKLILVITTCIN